MTDASIYSLHHSLRCAYISQLVNLARVEIKTRTVLIPKNSICE